MIISKDKTSLFFRLSISVTVFGALFSFIPWAIIAIGAMGMVTFHSIQFFQNEKRSPLDYARLLLIVFFSFNYIFCILNLPYAHVFTLLTKTALIAFLGFYVKDILASCQELFQDELILSSVSRESLSFMLADLATVYIVIASLFKILQWEFGIINGNLLLVLGLFSAVVSILASSKILGKQ